jgi:hypothetical protein
MVGWISCEINQWLRQVMWAQVDADRCGDAFPRKSARQPGLNLSHQFIAILHVLVAKGT